MTIFFLEIFFFVFSLLSIFVLRKIRNSFFFLPLILTTILGSFLFFLTLWQQVSGILKLFLLLVGIAPAGMFISIILHNFISSGITKLRCGKEFEEPVFFLLGAFGCPIIFLVGTVGTVVYLVKIFTVK